MIVSKVRKILDTLTWAEPELSQPFKLQNWGSLAP
jgi:hypothetical protein